MAFLQSMTGFGAAEREGVKVEIRSLNHRYLDVSFRAPGLLLPHEIPLRTLVRERFSRGKFDLVVSLTDKALGAVRIDKEAAKEIYRAFSELQRELSLPGSLTIDFFTGYQSLLLTQESELAAESLLDAAKEALSRLEEMRRHEGETLKGELEQRLDTLVRIHAEVEEIAAGTVAHYREALAKRIAELVSQPPVDEGRLAQEVAIAAQKMDITEELTRLKSHLHQFRSVLGSGGVVGRRLDFLLQEMHREANTISSKALDVRIVKATIDMKTDIEKLREQAQNIE